MLSPAVFKLCVGMHTAAEEIVYAEVGHDDGYEGDGHEGVVDEGAAQRGDGVGVGRHGVGHERY